MKAIYALAIVALTALAAAGFLHSGIYHVGADEPHWPVTLKVAQTLRDRSIALRARDIPLPADLNDAARVRRGAGNYDAMCTGCHLRPGARDSEIRRGLYPQPPNLALAVQSSPRNATDTARLAARRFWVIKHGIKMSAMPAWSVAGVDDDTIWDMVALLQQLPELSPEAYAALVQASPGHTHGDAEAGAPVKNHRDAPGTPPHRHAGPPQEKKSHEHSH